MKKGGLFSGLFGGGDKYDPVESFLKYMIFREVMEEQENKNWRDSCEDGSDIGVFPLLHDTKEEYEEALDRYRWRRWCEDGSEYDLNPLNFASEEEYDAALEKAKWCAECEDGSEYCLDSKDFNSKEEYDEALAREKYAWRTTCRDGSAFELDPLDFDSREEYDSRLDELIRRKEEEECREKDRWRWYNCEGPRYGVFPENYETQEEYEKDLKERKAAVEAERAARLRSRIEAAARKKVEEMKEREEEAHKGEPDSLAATDETEYTFCGVTFLHGWQIYYYRTDNETIAVGDRVIVPIGNEGRTIVAEVAAVEKHTRATAPYPVDRVKFVLRKVDPQNEE